MDDQQWLRRNFGCAMHDEALLAQALSHRSVGSRNNERLEFLGDAVLGYVISEDIYRRFPDADEGQMSRLRVALVKGSALADLARELDLTEQIRLGAGERSGGGRQRSSILADTLEALFGALLLDRGADVCRDAILRIFRSRLEQLDPATAQKDPKTRLQELLQADARPLPRYEVLESRGEDHQRVFRVRVSLDDAGSASRGGGAGTSGSVGYAEAEGGSRRAAEQAAADKLLAALESRTA